PGPQSGSARGRRPRSPKTLNLPYGQLSGLACGLSMPRIPRGESHVTGRASARQPATLVSSRRSQWAHAPDEPTEQCLADAATLHLHDPKVARRLVPRGALCTGPYPTSLAHLFQEVSHVARKRAPARDLEARPILPARQDDFGVANEGARGGSLGKRDRRQI